ncbi:MAG: hypothetical protein HN350_02550 [Phycisphaerales bacterium]|jgi:hypothetical protein|nr:hypothetical protein [Phycisphaerales bacterium]
MFFPPSLLRLRIVRNGQRQRNLFVPLIIIWPILLAGMLVPMAVMAILNHKAAWRTIKAICRFASLASDARRTHIEISNTRDNILLYLW